MALFNCFPLLSGRKKKNQGDKEYTDYNKGLKTLEVKLEHAVKSSKTKEVHSTSFNVSAPYASKANTTCKVKVMNHESPVTASEEETADIAYEAEDEHDEYSLFKRNFSDHDLQAHVPNTGEDDFKSENRNLSFHILNLTDANEPSENKSEQGTENCLIQSGHVSDPGIRKAEFWASPKLKRSCSNLETGIVRRKPSKSRSSQELQELAERFKEVGGNPRSPRSVRSHCSADRVMLKKHSSAQILPSRSRKLWWKLFLWSHRNLHNAYTGTPLFIPISNAFNQKGGYSSDNGEPNRVTELKETESPRSFSGESRNDNLELKQSENQSLSSFHGGDSGSWPQNQWVAFASESSSFDRVDRWVKDLEIPVGNSAVHEENDDMGIVFPASHGRSPGRSAIERSRYPTTNLSEEILHANRVIQSLNSSSNVAHIAGIGLNVIPNISLFSSLRSVNLSNNFIAQITPGSLPKGLHTLNLSKNKVSTIEGLRELTRLRVLDLSYNRISRIGYGLSNCTMIKELYLGGSKISDVEGLHRLLKLTVLDLSFNKITTTKGLGQLVANYNSLLALNLLGNPVQTNISDEQLRRAISGLLPKLAYLNKQPIKPQRAREVVMDNVARAALGNSSWSSRKKSSKRASQVTAVSSSSVNRSRRATTGHGSRHRSRSRTHQDSPLKISSSRLASSSR